MNADIAALISNKIDLWTGAVERRPGAGRGGGKTVRPYGIDRLRGLILDLAVRGKLVPQHPDDGQAAKLLASIEAEKISLFEAGASKRMAPVKTPAAWPFKVPDSWVWSQIGTITNYGETEKANPGEVEDDTWVLELEDVEKGSSKLLEKVRHSSRQFQSQKNRFRPGDVIYGKLRPYLDKVLIADEAGVCTTEMVPMRGYHGVETAYLRWYLKSPFFIEFADNSTHGMNLPRVGTDKARAAPIALPPLAEQRRIVSKVDELMDLCDSLETQSASAMDAHQALVETLLAALVCSSDADIMGQWTTVEAHFDTLFTTEASIRALKQTVLELAVVGKLIVGVDPASWIAAKLGEMIGPMDSGWSPACLEFPVRAVEAWGVLKTTAVQRLEFRPDENKELPATLQPRPAAECQSGDILITRAGPTNRVGICCYVSATPPHLMISDKIVRFRPSPTTIYGPYLALALSVGSAAAQIEKAKSGMAASQVNISQAKLREVVVSYPADISEQRRIVARVDELMSLCDALSARLGDADLTRKHLADAIVERAAA